MKRRTTLIILSVIAILLIAAMLYACTPYIEATVDRYPVNHKSPVNLENQYEPHSEQRRDAVVDRATNAMDNLLEHLNSDETSDTGYYTGADIVINTFDIQQDERSAFILKLRANLYTYPYEVKDENGNVILDDDGLPLVDEAKLAIHNELIKYNDIVLEWYDGMTNKMLIGFYFDGINPNSADPGNHLYLNLLGSKRIFLDFGDSVLYQQIVRLITKFDLNTLIGGGSDEEGSLVKDMADLLKRAVTSNYKEVINGDVTSLFFYNVDLGGSSAGYITETLTQYLQDFFGPFEDKVDPLSNKYLGFKFSTLGTTEITRLLTSMQFFVSTPRSDLGEIMTGLIIDVDGDSRVVKKRKNEQKQWYETVETVPFTARLSFDYSLRISTDIVIDKTDYKIYEYGNYEYIGDLFIPYLDLELDALIRTDINENNPKKGLDNSTNRVFAQFYDKSNNDVIIGLYYKDEITYIDITNLQHLYGGIKFEDIGLPKAFKEGFNLGELLATFFDLVDKYIVLMVDDLLAPSDDSEYDALTEAIMANMKSTMKDPDIPESRNTIRLRVTMELIRIVLRETSENGTDYTNKQLISLIDEMFGIEIESIAAILGMNVETLMETTFIDITYDVDEYSIRIDVATGDNSADMDDPGELVMRLDLVPTHLGEAVKISFPMFDNFKPLQKVMTYSGYVEGQIIFAATEEVDLSDLMGSFIGDLSGKNTPYILPEAADIYFTMLYDQYIRDQILSNGRWTRAGRSAFNIQFYIIENDERVDLFRVYANDVSFDTADPVEELGYVWVDLICVEGMPRMKIREDLFIESFYQYMDKDVSDDEGITIGLTTIIQAMLEDSWPVFEPDVIRITTSNQTFKDAFKVDELIATMSAQIGFKQRVHNIDELEANFAMYTVGEFKNIQGDSPYEIALHDTIKVYFDFGNRMEVKDFLFDYKPQSIAVANNTDFYYPTIDGLFMGVIRSYQVRITGGNRGRSRINRLVEGGKEWVWEPLRGGFPTTVAAYYGETANQQYNYRADFNFFAYYDRSIDYYIVPNDLGYKILYDKRKDVYIVDLYENHKIDKVYEILDPENDVIFLKNFLDKNDVPYSYDIGTGLFGYYVVENTRCNLLYNKVGDFYLVRNQADLVQARFVVGNEATIYVMETEIGGRSAYYDLSSGYYIIAHPDYRILYKSGVYYLRNENDLNAVKLLLNIENAAVAPSSVIDWNAVDFTKAYWNKVDWLDHKYDAIEWKEANWENMTLEGGLFIMEVVIGKGKMATYREFVDVKVLNRTVETDKYVNVNLYDAGQGASYKVKAPVADYIEVDPYVYILLRADYENNLKARVAAGELPASSLGRDFVEWFFKKYAPTIRFTEIYFNDNDTPDETGSFSWQFDYPDQKSVYKETNISNRVQEGTTDITYIYTNFNGQIVALGVYVLPRNIDYIRFDGENEPNAYTVDALIEDTYVIPRYPVIYFKETDSSGNPYTLDFADFAPVRSSVFAGAPALVSNNDISVKSVPAGMTKLQSVINWSNPVAENVKLINDRSTGTVLPFYRSNTNVTTSFVDIRNYTDPVGVWFADGWFSVPIISVAVDIPDKIVDTFGEGPFTYSDISVQQGSENGRFYADPYDASTWIIPSNIEVRFRNPDGTHYVKRYNVAWETGEHLEYVNGQYVLKGLTKEFNQFVLRTRIGNETVNYIDLRLLVDNMSGIVSRVEFLSEDGSVLAGDLDNAPDFLTDDGRYTYAYEVDTYSRFQIPAAVRVLFEGDPVPRVYASNWENNPPWAPGSIITINTVLGSALSLTEDVPLTFIIEDREIIDIQFVNRTASETVTYDIASKTITVYGAYFSDGLFNGRSPYDYFMHLFGELVITFAAPGKFGSPVTVYDAATSAEFEIIRTFDTQKLITFDGQILTIFLGQGAGADDYAVRIRIMGIEEITGGIMEKVVIEPFDITTNLPNYSPENPFVLNTDMRLAITYESGTVIYGKGNLGETPVPFDGVWYVRRPLTIPAEFTVNPNEPATNMAGISENAILSEIDWTMMMSGGYVWVTTMLPDSSRIYRRLEIAYVDIGDSFSSAHDDPSPFVIVNGLITITDIYSVYPLSLHLTAATLPSSIVTGSGSIRIPVGQWILLVSSEELSQINHLGRSEFLLAKAMVVGEEIYLRLRVLPAVITGISYTDAQSPSKSFASSGNVIYFDPYINFAYNGEFVLPNNLRFTFGTNFSHDNTNTVYYALNSAGQYITVERIFYTIYGHSRADMPDHGSITMRILMPDNQVYNFTIRFYDKTVTGIIVGSDFLPAQGVNSHTIDPYGRHDLPYTGNSDPNYRQVTVLFREGANIAYSVVSWTLPANYEIKYDTYRRVLLHLPDNVFKLTAPLTYTGLETQTLNLNVSVLDRVMDDWELIENVQDLYTGNSQNPNSTFHFSDPFAARVDDLPQAVRRASEQQTGSKALTDLPIIWQYADSEIYAEGTVVADSYGKYGRIVRGYLQSPDYGQPVTIRVFVNKWEFAGIRRPLGDGYQIMNEEIRFFFSKITDASSYKNYQIIIRETDPSSGTLQVNIRNIIFYPEDIAPPETVPHDPTIPGADAYPYRIIWDTEAKGIAKSAMQASGRFYLANDLGFVKMTPADIVFYQFETANISELNIAGYGYGTNNNAIYVVNPFNPIFSDNPATPGVMKAMARGTLNQEHNADLGEVTVYWTGGTTFSDIYVKGGIYRGYPVTVVLERDGVEVHRQRFDIMLVFLDMSPTGEVNMVIGGDVPHNLLSASVKTVYTATTYGAGEVNPYRDSYPQVMAALNKAVADLGLNIGDNAKFDYNSIEWEYSDAQIQSMTSPATVYSRRVTIGTMTYDTNFVKLKISAPPQP